MKRYANLHTHTEYSNIRLIDSINTVNLVIDRAIQLGMSGVAITDHECLSGHVKAIQYYKKLSEAGKVDNFKLALGDEIYLVDDFNQRKMNHFILVAKDKEGYELLKEISSTAWKNAASGGFKVPILKTQLSEIVSKNKGKLIASTACIGGEVPMLILAMNEHRENALNAASDAQKEYYEGMAKETKKKIIEFINFGKNLFGEDFYLEVQPSNQPEQIIVNETIKKLAKASKVKIIVTTDAHYLTKEESSIHKAFLNSKDGDREVDTFYESAYLMSTEEIEEWPSIKDVYSSEEMNIMYENTNDIMDKIETYDLFAPQEIAMVEFSHLIPELKKNNGDAVTLTANFKSLSKLVNETDDVHLYWIYKSIDFLRGVGKLNNEYLSRLEDEAKELYLISENLEFNMFAYYTTMSKIIEICWEKGDSIVGPGRGSANGFLSCYTLEITQDDPLVWGMPAWRHISSTRPELPKHLGK